ncbi:MAG: chromate efflux transporter [Dehalococcoidia bacterium]
MEVLWVALRLGLTSFGGPVAHLGYFREEYVRRRRWLDDAAYADLVALCQFLPGPASSQVGIAIGTLRAGWLGGLLAWIGFTLPSAIAMVLFAYGLATFEVADAGWLHGLKVAAVAVVANALWGMAPGLAAGRVRAAIAIGAATVVLAVPSALVQVAVIVLGGLAGWRLLGVPGGVEGVAHRATPARGRTVAGALLVAFFALLVLLPVARAAFPSQAVAMADVYYRVGSLVFGGGHVVLPLLQSEVVPPGWVTADGFIAGFGAAQAVPGPLFTFAAFLGAAQTPAPTGWLGATVALVAIYVPSFLLVWGTLPFWGRLRTVGAFQSTLRGMGAAVVGILLAALYTPVWTSAILGPRDFALAVVCFGMLAVWRVPPSLVVVVAALGGMVLAV